MHMGPPIDNTAVQWTTSNVVTATKPEHAKQRWWNEKVHKAKLTDFNRMAIEAEITRIKCQQKPSTSIWLSAQPNSALALKLTNTEMCILLGWWLGAPVLGEEHDGQPCPLCDEPIDVQGAHFLLCKKAGNHLRHDNICESIAALAHAAGVRIKREKVIYGQNRPDDILLYGWREGKAAAMDITIVNPLLECRITQPSLAIDAANIAQRANVRKHQQGCEEKGLSFIPFGITTFGAMGEQAEAT